LKWIARLEPMNPAPPVTSIVRDIYPITIAMVIVNV
jgi:hypothetical protein